MRACVVLPAYNEEENVASLIERLMTVSEESGIEATVVVVNDGSQDGTAEVLRKLSAVYGNKLRIVDHGVNKGFGQAIRSGIYEALGQGCEAVVFMDCDWSHDPSDLPRFLRVLEKEYDCVLGSRYIRGGNMHDVPAWRIAISRIGNFVGRTVLKLPVRDLTTGYRGFRQTVLRGVELREDGFTIQLEAVVKTYAAGYSLGEVPIVVKGRAAGNSHMHYNYRFFVRYLKLLLACRHILKNAHRRG